MDGCRPFESRVQSKKSNTEWCWTFLAGALGLEPRAYGFGGIPLRLIFHCTATTFLFYCTGDTNLTQGIIQHTVRHALWSLSPLPKNLHYRFPIQIHIHFFRTN